MAIKQRKQVTGTTEQINAYAGVEGQLVWNKTTKRWVGMSGTAGTNYPMASERHQHSIANVTDLQKVLDSKATKTELTEGLAGKANSSHTHTVSQITDMPKVVLSVNDITPDDSGNVKVGALPLGHLFAWPFKTPPDGAIQCNGATYNRALYKDFFAYATSKGWVKTEAEWQSITKSNGGFCPYYSQGDGSTTFRTPKFAPFMQVAIASGNVGGYHKAGLPEIEGTISAQSGDNSKNENTGAFYTIKNGHIDGGQSGGSDYAVKVGFKASGSNAIYGRSTTVQPESHEWMICVVVAGQATNLGSVDMADVLSATAQVQAEIASIQQEIGNTTKFAAPDYKAGSTIAASTTVTIQTNGFLRYWIFHGGTGGKERFITINGIKLRLCADNWSTDYVILPVMKGDSVRHDGVDELMFYPARYGV